MISPKGGQLNDRGEKSHMYKDFFPLAGFHFRHRQPTNVAPFHHEEGPRVLTLRISRVLLYESQAVLGPATFCLVLDLLPHEPATFGSMGHGQTNKRNYPIRGMMMLTRRWDRMTKQGGDKKLPGEAKQTGSIEKNLIHFQPFPRGVVVFAHLHHFFFAHSMSPKSPVCF